MVGAEQPTEPRDQFLQLVDSAWEIPGLYAQGYEIHFYDQRVLVVGSYCANEFLMELFVGVDGANVITCVCLGARKIAARYQGVAVAGAEDSYLVGEELPQLCPAAAGIAYFGAPVRQILPGEKRLRMVGSKGTHMLREQLL
jgi:hypothetical protein